MTTLSTNTTIKNHFYSANKVIDFNLDATALNPILTDVYQCVTIVFVIFPSLLVIYSTIFGSVSHDISA